MYNWAVNPFALTPLSAAEISFEKQPEGKTWRLSFEGEIKAGDAQQLKRLISGNAKRYLSADYIFLNSLGGSVPEAIEISTILESSGLVATVERGGVCASACFLLYVAAPARFPPFGKILIHRPYYKMGNVIPAQYDKYAASQREAVSKLRIFFESRVIPSDLIDKMMSLPSNAAYEITPVDFERIGFMTPTIEEVAIEKCDFSNSNFLSGDVREHLRCLGDALLPMRVAYAATIMGRERTLEILQELAKEQRGP